MTFPFMDYAFGIIFKKSLPNPALQSFSPLFSSRIFIVLESYISLAMIYKLFQKLEEEEIFSNSFSKASITLNPSQTKAL